MKVLVVGGPRTTGTGIINRMLEKDYDVEILDITAKPYTDFKNVNIPYHWMAVQDVRPSDIKKYDTIIYLAAQADAPMGHRSPQWTCYQNVSGMINFLEAIRVSDRLEKFIVASSGTEYGRYQYLPIDEKHPLCPTSPYSWSKAAQEMAAMSYYYSHDVPTTIIGNGVITGIGMRKEIFIYIWISRLLQGKKIELHGGTQTRDLTYISDTLDAWELILNAPIDTVKGEKFQVSLGEEYSVEDLMFMCLDECGCDESMVNRTDYRPGEKGIREMFDITKAKERLGYDPKIKPRMAIKLTADWIRNLKG